MTVIGEAERDAIREVLDHVEEWTYEDRGHDYNRCPSCGWNTDLDRTRAVPLGHHPGCLVRPAGALHIRLRSWWRALLGEGRAAPSCVHGVRPRDDLDGGVQSKEGLRHFRLTHQE